MHGKPELMARSDHDRDHECMHSEQQHMRRRSIRNGARSLMAGAGHLATTTTHQQKRESEEEGEGEARERHVGSRRGDG